MEGQKDIQLAVSSDEESVRLLSSRRFVRGPKAIMGVVASVALLLAAAGVCFHQARSVAAPKGEDSNDVYEQLAEVDAAQPLWQISTAERDLCSKINENCIETKCCKTSNFRCFKKSETSAQCAEKGTGEVLSRDKIVFQSAAPATSLFCFAVYQADTGSTKKKYDKEMLMSAFAKKIHVFACNAYEVYSDVATSLGDSFSTKMVHDVDGTFHFAKRKEEGTWINTGMYQQAWKAISAAGTYKAYDWTVKADADAVFFPDKLVNRIKLMPRATTGVILNNCKDVDYGFFGALEVFSEVAFSSLLANMDKCNKTLPWTIGIENGKYGPMGEDLFAEICLEKNGVLKIDAFDIKKDGLCPGDRPKDQKKNKKWVPNCAQATTPAIHPLRKIWEWEKCYTEASR